MQGITLLYSIVESNLLFDQLHLHILQVVKLLDLLKEEALLVIILYFDLHQLVVFITIFDRSFLPHHLQFIISKQQRVFYAVGVRHGPFP